MIGTIAMRELTEQVTSLRFLVITVLVIALTPLVVYVGARDYTERLLEYSRLNAEKQKVASGPNGEVRGVAGDDSLVALRAPRRPEPLSVLVRGLDGGLPVYWDFTPTGVEAGPPAVRPERLADILGTLDLEFLVRVVLGLLAILLAFDAISGEKELGTLRAVLSQPVSRAAFVTGKLAGGASTLVVSLLLTFAITLVSAPVFRADLLGGDSLVKIALMFATSACYLVCLFALGLLVSATTTSQKSSLVILLVAWVVTVLAMTPLATIVAQAASPAPPRQALDAKKRAAEEDLRRARDAAISPIYREISGKPSGWMDTRAYREHKEAFDQLLAPILMGYYTKRRRFTRELDDDAERRRARQNSIASAIAACSPASAYAGAAAELAITGDANRRAWIDSIRLEQSRLEVQLFDDPPTIVLANGGAYGWIDRRKPPRIWDLPQLTPPRGDPSAAFSRALPSLGLLALYTGIFIISAFAAFSRYDVR